MLCHAHPCAKHAIFISLQALSYSINSFSIFNDVALYCIAVNKPSVPSEQPHSILITLNNASHINLTDAYLARWQSDCISYIMASNISKVSVREEPNGWVRVKRFQEVFKVVLLGDSGVGKTSLGYQYVEEKTLQKPHLTVGFDYWTKELEIEDETVKVGLYFI